MKNQGKDLDHLPVAPGTLGQQRLQAPEGLRHLGKGGSVAQGSGFALDHRQVMPPIIDRAPRQMMGSFDDTAMFAQDLPLRGDHDPVGIDPQTDGTIGEGGRHGVADTLEVDQTCRRDPLGLFDKAIKGSPWRHQTGDLPGMHISNHPR
jgi:hypothetical protein